MVVRGVVVPRESQRRGSAWCKNRGSVWCKTETMYVLWIEYVRAISCTGTLWHDAGRCVLMPSVMDRDWFATPRCLARAC